MKTSGKTRCLWAKTHPLLMDYHDHEWGSPVHDDQRLFEFILLESAQAGLNWLTILKKREAYRYVYDDFDPEKVARYSEARIRKLLNDPGIVRNRRKVASSIVNAQAFLRIQREFGGFHVYIWRFVKDSPIQNRWKGPAEIPSKTRESEAMSKDLKKRGFTFVGPTICYAFMQAVGMVNDHAVDCFRYHDLNNCPNLKP